MGGTGTDGERPLEHSVMKRSTEDSLMQRAFQTHPVGVRANLFSSLTPDVFFFPYVQLNCYRCHIQELFPFAHKY